MESLKIATFNSGMDSCGFARMDYNCGCFAILAAESGSTGIVLFHFSSDAAGFVWIGQTAAETSTGAGVLRGKSRFTAACELDVFFRCGISFGGGLPVARFDTGGRRRRVSGPVCAGREKSIG